MTAGIHNIATSLITPTVFLPQTLDFVERERERESLSAGEAKEREKGARYEGRGARFRWLSEEL
jgi:hypothetical protein